MPQRKPGQCSIHLAKRIFNRGEDESLRRALKVLGWVETSNASAADVVWDVWLSDAEADQHAALVPGQVMSRFPSMADCCRKAVFATLFSRLRRLLPVDTSLNDGRFIPAQFSLPQQKDAMREHVEAATSAANRHGQSRPYYIVKPDVGSRGDGIRLTAEPERKSWSASGERVVQQYIGRPMLIDGLKFDLRLYVLVTDVQDTAEEDTPMRIFLFREGLARFAVDMYEPPSSENAKNTNMHLTNYSLTKKTGKFKYCDDVSAGRRQVLCLAHPSPILPCRSASLSLSLSLSAPLHPLHQPSLKLPLLCASPLSCVPIPSCSGRRRRRIQAHGDERLRAAAVDWTDQ
jgi:hypothetical protein